ncbi:MAG: phosphatidylglycerophosphatase A [Deltaproteobacteria bacterium]|jgi:phosphatidylglycerophosphatase A|nr:phosphatidylglycerophosphatase A [Deltaproteobacteria bacterium]
MNFREKAVLFLATGFYVGNIPPAPGTLGSLIGLALCFLLAGIPLPPAIILAVLFIGFAVWIAHAAEKTLKKKDPGCIVIDEVAGMVVTLIGLPFNLTTAVIGFIIFRILDILKPFPIRTLDKRLAGGIGIVADDVVAGIFANIILRVLLYISDKY